ncbi:MAG: thioredoxin family protein [Chitinispirillales bacterium]|jgi:thioredoxin 1|nr:thioredoxin family protein [Chitinispirillales bacterium]
MRVVAVMFMLLLVGVQASCAQRRADESQQLADRIVKSEIPVMVDFWASWCGACRALEPTIEELKREYKDRVLFMRVDVDIHREITQYFRVQGIPAVFIVEDKTVRTKIPGMNRKEAYRTALDEALKLAAERSAEGRCQNC